MIEIKNRITFGMILVCLYFPFPPFYLWQGNDRYLNQGRSEDPLVGWVLLI